MGDPVNFIDITGFGPERPSRDMPGGGMDDTITGGGPGGGMGGGSSPITGYTRHGINQAISRDGVGVCPKAINDAVRNPINIQNQSGGRTLYEGKGANVILNTQGEVITAIPHGSEFTRTGSGK